MKRARKTKAQSEALLLGVGEFPDVVKISHTKDTYKGDMIAALNYASAVFDNKQLKDFVKEYSKKSFSKVPDWEFIHIGQIAWLILAGANISPTSKRDLDNRIDALNKKYESEKEESAKVIQFKVAKDNKNLENFEGFLDDLFTKGESDFSFEGFSASDLKYVKTKINDILSDIELTQKGSEGGYEYLTKRALSNVVKVFAKLIEKVSASEISNVKQKRTVIRKRKINPTKMVSKLKYLKRFPELEMTSIQPEKIVGAKVLWVYNTKTRKLGKYESETSFLIKGSTLLNYSPEKSIQKTVRKPEVVKTLLEMGKVELRKFLPSIKAVETKLNGRINKDVILLMVS